MLPESSSLSRPIQVFRAGSSERTAITNREFAGYYRDEKIFTVNKDETWMKKTVVDGELTVGDCKFIPYSSDTEEGLNITLID